MAYTAWQKKDRQSTDINPKSPLSQKVLKKGRARREDYTPLMRMSCSQVKEDFSILKSLLSLRLVFSKSLSKWGKPNQTNSEYWYLELAKIAVGLTQKLLKIFREKRFHTNMGSCEDELLHREKVDDPRLP
ncbi:unnamed protein product [Ceratitis capitata]|uniref:(Mediterranean fruit fly) hypothetical protein n=1 Tax=Ceratitis capitata TaxID=7213 RepID=A0A811VDF0_CERCA|nr:unnamed protein product [Ceratitis capitata]